MEANIGDRLFDLIIPADDEGGTGSIKALLTNRWNAVSALYGLELQVVRGANAATIIAEETQDNPYLAKLAVSDGNPSPSYEVAAAAGQQVYARYANDPVLSYNNLALNGISAPPLPQQFNEAARQSILQALTGTVKYDKDGTCRLEAVPLAWKPDGGGFYYVSNGFTVMYVGRIFANLLGQYISNFKFHDTSAPNGTPVPPGAVSLSTIRADLIGLYAQLVGEGIVEDADTFVNNLVVQRNAATPSKLEVVLPVNIQNAIRQIAITVSWTQ